MINRSSIQIGRAPFSAVSTALSVMRGTPQSVAAYVIVIILVQSISALFVSDDLWSRKGFHFWDAMAIGISLFLQSYFWCGLLTVSIHAVRGHPTSISNLFPPLGAFLRTTIVGLAMSIPVALGFLLLIIPGVYLGLMWSMAIPLIIDGRARYFDSLRLSADFTKGHRGELFIVFLVPGLMQAPAKIIDRVSDKFEFFESALGATTLFIVGLWQILVMVFLAVLIGVLYQYFHERTALGNHVALDNALTLKVGE